MHYPPAHAMQQQSTSSIVPILIVSKLQTCHLNSAVSKYTMNALHQMRLSSGTTVHQAACPILPGAQCMICFETFPRSSMLSAACKHGFCTDCWSGYLANAVSSGPSVLDLRCPLPDCKAEVSSRTKLLN
eukprot:GHRR01009180.1.p5 GENE.GHRR01009180.1~~GHRR01009180.1.p5  ORF type:complete len:130 (-),score=36.64 GHRR01009180.1:4021-4410(-)